MLSHARSRVATNVLLMWSAEVSANVLFRQNDKNLSQSQPYKASQAENTARSYFENKDSALTRYNGKETNCNYIMGCE